MGSNLDMLDLMKSISRRVKALDDSSELRHRVSELEVQLALKERRIQTLEDELDRLKRPLSQDEELHRKVNELVSSSEDMDYTQKKILKKISKLSKKLIASPPLTLLDSPSKSSSNEETAWASGMTLIGDELWKNFSRDSELDAKIKSTMPSLRITSKEGQSIFGLFDDKRGQVVIPLPADSKSFALSIGARDLRENALINLKKGSLEEVRRHNLPILLKKASSLKSLIMKLLSMSPSLIYVLPPRGFDERIEVHLQWEELVRETLKSIPFPKLKIIHFPGVIKKAQGEYERDRDFKRDWFGTKSPEHNASPLILGSLASHRLLEELSIASTALSPALIGMDPDWPIHKEEDTSKKKDAVLCGRCTRIGHSNEDCKSLKMLCRVCGTIGHFAHVHEATDPKVREIIVRALGVDIFDDEESDAKRAKLA